MGRRIEDFHKELFGKTLEEAREIAEKEGYVIRVAKEDNEWKKRPRDYRLDRINVELAEGIITARNMTIE